MKNLTQETLEEAAVRLVREHPDFETEGYSEYQNGRLNGILDGAAWQAERMYSEEEVLELLHKRMIHNLGDDYQETTTTKWFEQHKKK